MSKSKHIPKLPFKLDGCSGRMIEDAESYLVCVCDLLVNAELIVRACNSHNALLKACKYTQEMLSHGTGQSTHALALIEQALKGQQ